MPAAANDSSNQTTTSGSDDETCNTCERNDCVITTSNNQKQTIDAKWIQCDSCRCWYHSLCQNLSKPDFNAIIKLADKGVRWYCTECIKKNVSDISKSPSLPQSVDDRFNKIEENINKLSKVFESSLELKFGDLTKTYAAATKINQESIQQSIAVNTSARSILNRSLAQSDAETRKCNAILYGLEDNKEQTANAQIEEMLKNECFKHINKPIQSFWLGKAKEDSKQRPVKVKFEDENSKWDFVKRVNSALRTGGFFCKLDSNKETRDAEYTLRQQMRELKTINSDAQYRIRNLNIEQKTPSGEWKAMKPEKNLNKSTTI